MRRLSGGIVLLLAVLNGLCAQDFYPVASIADSLRSGSNAVIRYHNTTYTRTSIESYTESIAYAVTILNARGKSDGRLVIPYDRNSEIIKLSGIVYMDCRREKSRKRSSWIVPPMPAIPCSAITG